MLTPGTKIGGFLLGDLLGKGAMGEVYKGEQLSLKRPVAIKRIATHLLENEDMVRRFKREAQVLAKVSHPNVVGVIECEEFPGPDGTHHLLLIMELIEGGRSLKSHLGKPIDWRLATTVVRMCADGLAAAFEQHVVHRDIKPDNIMMTRKGIAKLVDFGLAKAAESTALTMQAAPMGTPLFMAPEACRGEEIGHAGDLYSLGVSWFYMLTGRYPFEAANLHGLLYKHISEPPPPPTGLFDNVPPQIVQLVYQCLEKDIAKRPASAIKLVEAIEALPGQGLLLPRDARELMGAGLDGTHAGGGSTTAATLVAGKVDKTAATLVQGGKPDANAATVVSDLSPKGAAHMTVSADLSPQGAVAQTVVSNLSGEHGGQAATTPTAMPGPRVGASTVPTALPRAAAPESVPDASAPKKGNGAIIGIAAAAVVVLGIGGWLVFGGSKPAPAPAPAVATTPPTPPITPTTTTTTVVAPIPVPIPGPKPGTTTTPTVTAPTPDPVVQSSAQTAPPKPVEPPKPVAAPQTAPPPAETPKPVEPPKPIEEPKPEPPKPVEQPKPVEPPKPVEAPKPVPPPAKPDTGPFEKAVAGKQWGQAKSASDALPEPAKTETAAKLTAAADTQVKGALREARALVKDEQYLDAAKRLLADKEAAIYASPDVREGYRNFADTVRKAAKAAQENP